MEALESALRGFWLATAAHLWQTSWVWAALFAAALFFRSAPARHQEALWWTAVAKLLLPLPLLAPLAAQLRFPFFGEGERGRFVTALSVLADPLGASGTGASGIAGFWTAVTAFWIAGATVVLWRGATGGRGRRRTLAASSPAARARIEAALVSTEIPGRSILVRPDDAMPSVEGIVRPRIVIAERTALALSEQDLRAVLLHEEAHLRRLDPMFGLVQRFVLAFFFYFPPLWLVLRRLGSAVEFRCDERAARALGRPEEYARALARTLALGLAPSRGCGAGGTRRSSVLEERFTRIREPRRYFAMRRHRIALAAALVLVALSSFLPIARSEPDGAEVQEPLSLGPDMTPPERIAVVQPVYPEEARKNRAQGKVTLQAVIEVDGTIGDVRVEKGVPEAPALEEAAVEAVRQWRYKPALRNGTPVRIYFTINVDFVLN